MNHMCCLPGFVSGTRAASKHRAGATCFHWERNLPGASCRSEQSHVESSVPAQASGALKGHLQPYCVLLDHFLARISVGRCQGKHIVHKFLIPPEGHPEIHRLWTQGKQAELRVRSSRTTWHLNEDSQVFRSRTGRASEGREEREPVNRYLGPLTHSCARPGRAVVSSSHTWRLGSKLRF